MGHRQGGGGREHDVHTSHLSQTCVHIQTVFFSQNGPTEVRNTGSGSVKQWVNQETYRLLTREAQPARSCNPLSADDIKPIIPMQARWITDFLSSVVSGYQDLFESACLGWREFYSWKVFGSGVLVNTLIQHSLNEPNSLEGQSAAARYLKCPKTVWENWEFL